MATAGKMQFETREAGPVAVLDVGGSVTMGEEAQALKKLLRDKLDKKQSVLVNLAGLRYMDSSGVGALVEAKAHAISHGVQLRLCQVPHTLDKVLRELHLRQILEVYDTESEALGLFQ